MYDTVFLLPNVDGTAELTDVMLNCGSRLSQLARAVERQSAMLLDNLGVNSRCVIPVRVGDGTRYVLAEA